MKKLLIIENDIDTLETIDAVLEDSIFEVVKSQKVLSIHDIIELDPCLIIIDYLLGDAFGNELCLEIKSNPVTEHIPVILYSASYKIEQLAHDSFADAFISKPFDLNYFVQMVNEVAL